MKALTVILVLVAWLVAIVGIDYLSEATLGVGIICSACFLGIMARIAQASAHHRESGNEGN